MHSARDRVGPPLFLTIQGFLGGNADVRRAHTHVGAPSRF